MQRIAAHCRAVHRIAQQRNALQGKAVHRIVQQRYVFDWLGLLTRLQLGRNHQNPLNAWHGRATQGTAKHGRALQGNAPTTNRSE